MVSVSPIISKQEMGNWAILHSSMMTTVSEVSETYIPRSQKSEEVQSQKSKTGNKTKTILLTENKRKVQEIGQSGCETFFVSKEVRNTMKSKIANRNYDYTTNSKIIAC